MAANQELGYQRLAKMISADPGGEISCLRNGKTCRGYISKEGVLYYASMPEVDLDAVSQAVNVDELQDNGPR